MKAPCWTVALLWWAVELTSRLLDPNDRDAVLGDVAEVKAGPSRALCDIGGLILQRQVQIWRSMGPWLALVTVAIPVGVQLSHLSRGLADGNAIYSFLYINNWTWGFLDNPGARRDMVALAGTFLLSALTLGGYAWISGYALASISRRAAWTTGALFMALVFVGTVATPSPARMNRFNHAVFSVPFYEVVFPRLVRLFCVVLPAAWGMRSHARVAPLSLAPTVLAVAVLVALTTGISRTGQAILFGRGPFDPGPDATWGSADYLQRLVRLMVVLWPVAYVVTSSTWRRWRPEGQVT